MSGTPSSGNPNLKRDIWELLREALYTPLEERLSALGSPASVPPKEPPDSALARILHHPSVILILGHRGSGKSVLACRLQELLRDIAPPYAVGLPRNAVRLLPTWYGLTDEPLDIPINATIYIPESYRLIHARSSQTAQGRALGELVNLSRHRRHTLIFDVQNPAHLDRNIISEVDVVLVKQPGPLTKGFERPQLRPIMDAARAAFAGVAVSRRKRLVWLYVPGDNADGRLMENMLPTFWSDGLSRVFSDTIGERGNRAARAPLQGKKVSGLSDLRFRRGRRTTIGQRQEKARTLRQQGYSYSEIGRVLGVGKSQAFRLVNGSS